MAEEGLDEQLTFRVSREDARRIEALSADLPIKEAGIMRAALRLGLTLLEEDPANMLRTGADNTKD